jgi:hypothetical protein
MSTVSRLNALIERLETFLNREIPNTPRITGSLGGRVMYVPLPGSRRSRASLSKRAAEVLAMIERNHAATSGQIQATLNVNRNVVAGAIHELKQFRLVKPQPIDEGLLAVGTSGTGNMGRRVADVDGAPAHNRRAKDRPEGPSPVGTVGRSQAAPKARRRRRQGRK